MVGFVAGLQRPQDVPRLLRGRFVHIHGLKPPRQRRVFLNMLAKLVQGRGPHRLQLPPGQGRLEHIAGVQPAFARPRAHQGMHFVQKHNHLALGRFDLVNHGLQAFLELAPELGPGHQTPHIQGHHPPVPQGIGHIAGHDFAGQPLGDDGLAHAGLANEHRVVLGAPRQRLHHLPDFGLAPHHRIQPVLARQFGQVNAVLFQRAVALLGVPVIHPVGAPQLLHRLIHHFLVQPQLAEQARRIPRILAHRGQQQMLHADVGILQPPGFLIRVPQRRAATGG